SGLGASVLNIASLPRYWQHITLISVAKRSDAYTKSVFHQTPALERSIGFRLGYLHVDRLKNLTTRCPSTFDIWGRETFGTCLISLTNGIRLEGSIGLKLVKDRLSGK